MRGTKQTTFESHIGIKSKQVINPEDEFKDRTLSAALIFKNKTKCQDQ